MVLLYFRHIFHSHGYLAAQLFTICFTIHLTYISISTMKEQRFIRLMSLLQFWFSLYNLHHLRIIWHIQISLTLCTMGHKDGTILTSILLPLVRSQVLHFLIHRAKVLQWTLVELLEYKLQEFLIQIYRRLIQQFKDIYSLECVEILS